MQRFALYGTVVVAGAAVLAIEILGTRVLGPFYGVSLFLWSALITVTLVALSAGYWLGGRWADRGLAIARLGVLSTRGGRPPVESGRRSRPAVPSGTAFGARASGFSPPRGSGWSPPRAGG
jgi:hypothetical protein